MAELIQAVVQKLSQWAAVVSIPCVFAVDGVQCLIPEDGKATENEYRRWQYCGQREIELAKMGKSQNRHYHTRARYEIWAHGCRQPPDTQVPPGVKDAVHVGSWTCGVLVLLQVVYFLFGEFYSHNVFPLWLIILKLKNELII